MKSLLKRFVVLSLFIGILGVLIDSLGVGQSVSSAAGFKLYEDYATVKYVKKKKLKVHARPSASSKVIKNLRNDDLVRQDTYPNRQGWIRIYFRSAEYSANWKTGYIKKKGNMKKKVNRKVWTSRANKEHNAFVSRLKKSGWTIESEEFVPKYNKNTGNQISNSYIRASNSDGQIFDIYGHNYEDHLSSYTAYKEQKNGDHSTVVESYGSFYKVLKDLKELL